MRQWRYYDANWQTKKIIFLNMNIIKIKEKKMLMLYVCVFMGIWDFVVFLMTMECRKWLLQSLTNEWETSENKHFCRHNNGKKTTTKLIQTQNNPYIYIYIPIPHHSANSKIGWKDVRVWWCFLVDSWFLSRFSYYKRIEQKKP